MADPVSMFLAIAMGTITCVGGPDAYVCLDGSNTSKDIAASERMVILKCAHPETTAAQFNVPACPTAAPDKGP